MHLKIIIFWGFREEERESPKAFPDFS